MNSSKGDLHRYDDFPIIGLVVSNPRASVSHDEISFSGLRQSCCVCFIDMINSTKITAELIDVEISKYYTIFLNAMATIATNFGARIVKNAGDSLIYYFPKIEGGNTNVSAFKDVLECAITMIVAHGVINGKLHEEKLPFASYRISADYGKVAVARSSSSQSQDLFGSVMNICAKINSKAPPNGIVIGQDLYEIVKSFNDYTFKEVGKYPVGLRTEYEVYSVTPKEKRNILNPFERMSYLQPRNPCLDYVDENNKLDNAGTASHNNPPTIMLVEDEPDALLAFETILTSEGYVVEAFTEPEKALNYFERLDRSYFDLVITDLKMPTLNGLELYQKLRAISANIKVLFVSALDAAEMLTSVLPGVQSDDIMRKPVDRENLIKTVKAALSHQYPIF